MAQGPIQRQSKRHWLDPLARTLLEATGQLPPRADQGPRGSAGRTDAAYTDASRSDAGRSDAARNTNGHDGRNVAPHPVPASTPPARANPSAPQDPADEEIEAELLALKLHQNPAHRLRNAAEVRRAAALGWRLDVNRACGHDWLRLPGCEPAHADLLLRLQAGGVQLSGPEDLQQLLNLSETQIRCWLPLLEFRWYGEPALPAAPSAVDLNQAPAATLQTLPGLTPQRCQRLVRERQRRPLRDLADLQQRLQLPAAVVEGLIGRVEFGQGQAGPSLPPQPGRRPGPT